MVGFLVFVFVVLVVIYIIRSHLLSKKVWELEYKLDRMIGDKIPERAKPVTTTAVPVKKIKDP
ncbi:MAG: hypothetical protein ABSB78_01030 [Bacteroidota bacterium]